MTEELFIAILKGGIFGVFAALFGYLLAGDRLTAVQAAGGILMIAAVMMVEVVGREQKRSLRQPVEPATPTVQPTD